MATEARGVKSDLLMRALAAIVLNSTYELLRNPFFLAVFLITVFSLCTFPYLTGSALTEHDALLRDVGLGTQHLMGLCLGVYSAMHLMRSGREDAVSSLILTKPVWKVSFIISRYLSILVVLFLFFWGTSIVSQSSLFIGAPSNAGWKLDVFAFLIQILPPIFGLFWGALANYFFSAAFKSQMSISTILFYTLGLSLYFLFRPDQFYQLDFLLVKNVTLLFMACSLLSGFALLFATRLNGAAAFLMTVLVFLMGLSSDYLFFHQQEADSFSRSLYYFIPNFQVFWWVDQGHHSVLTWNYIWNSSHYFLMYLIALLALTTTLFKGRELR